MVGPFRNKQRSALGWYDDVCSEREAQYIGLGVWLILRGCAVTTIRKVAVSIPDGVIGIFHWHNPSGHTMVLGLTQPLIQKRTRNISCAVKAVGVPIVLKPGNLNPLQPSGPVQACNGIALPIPLPLFWWWERPIVISLQEKVSI